jgi:hypothetical protein
MAEKRKIAMVVAKMTFAEAEEADIEYYASIGWKESAEGAEQIRRMIWSEAYGKQETDRVVSVAKLNDDRDDFE